MNHKQKVKLAKKLSGKQKRYFESTAWQAHKNAIEEKVARMETRQKEMAEARRKRKEAETKSIMKGAI